MDSMGALKIYDNEYLENSLAIQDLAVLAENKMKRFCDILIGLRYEEAFCGATAEAIEAFAVLLKSTLSDYLSSSGILQNSSMISYVNDIDVADEALY